MTQEHDPADRETCSYCGIAEDIHLLDGVLDADGNDTGKLACIACYPVPDTWEPCGVEHIEISIAPSLMPRYAAWNHLRLLRKHAYKLSSVVLRSAIETLDSLTYYDKDQNSHILASPRYMKALRKARRQSGRLRAAILGNSDAITEALRKYEAPLLDAASLFEDGAALNY
ncbi:hypothetical protein DYI24_00145 [Rhodopseudomonas sp. BR0C11]|uniref:hypothetical protein n=1 Tax=Rhodopseudomonas sp. BR0C11 TaxID=2269370 RepID=UPI0013E0BCDF|nr:hypothetical protein [Rhodopseudomonas sp. BR0C11]NEV75491.1 hypothetical protein [Rhodopseudomonas sp. BR0C11]